MANKEISIWIKAKDLASTTLTKVKGHFGIFGKSAASAGACVHSWLRKDSTLRMRAQPLPLYMGVGNQR